VENWPFWLPFVMALAHGLHCLGMCGGIAGAFLFSLPEPVRGHSARWILYLGLAHGGRLVSYVLAGGLASYVSRTFLSTLSPAYGHMVLQGVSSLFLVGMGLHIGGHPIRGRVFERLGTALWHHLQPVAQRLIVCRTPWHALLFGAVWGWLPCSLVYVVLLWSATACSVGESMQIMLLFGLGTVVTTLPSGMLLQRLRMMAGRLYMKEIFALVLIVLGGVNAYRLVVDPDVTPQPMYDLHHQTGTVCCRGD
jgi:sulfite exporter TauE/SafE